MKGLIGLSVLAFGMVLISGAHADEWSQNDQNYFDDNINTSYISPAANRVERRSLPTVDISVMEIRDYGGADEFKSPALIEQYMSSDQ